MNNEDFNYIPRSAARLRNRDISDQHKALLKAGNPAGAAVLIKNRPELEAFSASLFNFIEQKLVFIEQQLSGKNREIFNVYSDTEPSSEEMEGKFFWNKEY
ncbi:hypothetical protein SAMN05216405_5542 [Lachnospiraceae bacterium NLAE-zl-G231]|nr:hypothetical protein SAMN05216405_5542 [Lachnospiraceae bacterium NLAE-zl-G231]